jgi:cholesterol transport system auxiliary component
MKAPLLTLTLASTLALAGCSSLIGGGEREPTTIYSPVVQVTPDAAWPTIPWSIVVSKPSAPRLLDSSRIAVRPAQHELQVYQGAAWAQSATDMLQDAVVRTLEDSNKTGGTGTTESGIRGTYKLVLEVRRFESDYASAELPTVQVVVNAKLVQSYDQSVAASRTFSSAQPVGSTEIAQVVQGFDRALSQVTGELAGWVLTSAQAHPPAEASKPKAVR